MTRPKAFTECSCDPKIGHTEPCLLTPESYPWGQIQNGRWHRVIEPFTREAFSQRRRAVCGVMVRPLNVRAEPPTAHVCSRCTSSRR